MSSIQILKRLYRDYTKTFLGKIFLSILFSLLVAGSTSSIAYLLDPAIEKIFIEKDKTLMLFIPIAIIVAFSTKGFSLYIARSILISVGANIRKIIQKQLFKSIVSSDLETMDKKHSGKYATHLTTDVLMIETLVTDTVLLITKDTLTLIGLLSVMFYQNWKLALFAMIMIPLASIFAKSLGKRMGKISTETMETHGIVYTFFLEVFKNHKVIKIFQREDYENKRADSHLENFKNKTIKIAKVMIRTAPIMECLTGFMIGGLIYFAGTLVLENNLSINNFFSFLAAMMLAYQPVRSLATLNIGIQQGLSAAKRILPIIDSEVKDKNSGKDLKITNGSIQFKNVSFKYANKESDILNSISLNINGGKFTALVGHSGAGKTTIMNLIPRFYEPHKGEIKIDNQIINNYSTKSIRENISLVSQDTSLFDDTIKNNIKYSNLEASEDDIIEASQLSYCDEFIKKMPAGYNTMIGENGVRLSGGEKQRLSIARAMLKKSKIILLDEATSSLDSETESKIQMAINTLTAGKTTLVIAHRLSTVINSNKIYVIDNGQVVAEGNHNELLENSDLYKNFYEKQITKN
tara:strand:- start:3278 stop:5011 length:1734 start_codon:yes stop_codon:yes gene_type:complete